ncbi:HAD hydrolase-like protein [candidate division KSB1 bacterium]|nr:HAD hydrolase-like protein [candidate division KSB1 bacterium]
MNCERIQDILVRIRNVKIAVYGDFCLDAYWLLDPMGGEISAETGLHSQAVSKQYYTLGGASNIVANLAALKPASIQVIGAVGKDIFGREMNRQFDELGVNTEFLVTQENNYETVVFGKRYLKGREEPRIDFGFFNKRSKETDRQIIRNIRTALKSCNVLIFNQQVPGSINDYFIKQANDLFKEFTDKTVLLDSRHFSPRFSHIYRKTNDLEAACLAGAKVNPDTPVALNEIKKFAQQLYRHSQKPVFITRGARGIVIADDQGIHEVPGIQFMKKLDTVGAGDTVISALGLCLAAGCRPKEAAEFANLAAGVTVQKLLQTGTASGEEILELCREFYYIYLPELAEDIRLANFIQDSEIEVCGHINDLELKKIKHVIFDHDGTISTLREGWKEVMEQVMVKCILGEDYEKTAPDLFHKVTGRVREYIDMTTGLQTIVQMQALVEMVKEFALVPPGKILDKFGYKKIYNETLMQPVKSRIVKIKNGELNNTDFTINGVVNFLKKLRDKGVTLYLASGTDREDVITEAATLGYADLFNGGIYGGVNDISKFSKKILIEKIIRDNGLFGPELAVFGDGPVEMQECRKHKGIAVGVASDELRRFGLNKGKRTRLIKAGAQMIIPDFSQTDKLLKILF